MELKHFVIETTTEEDKIWKNLDRWKAKIWTKLP